MSQARKQTTDHAPESLRPRGPRGLGPDGTATTLSRNAFAPRPFPDRAQYLRGLVHLLRAGGRLVAIDWHKRKTPIGPPPEHRISREDFLSDAAKVGLHLLAEPTFLPNQYFVILAPAGQ